MPAISGTPQPLPPSAQGNPQSWIGAPLARLEFKADLDNGQTKAGEIEAYASQNLTDILVGDGPLPLFIKAGKSFDRAVELATIHAREADKWQRAAAVLQADDGNYYVTHLATQDNKSLRWDGNSYGWDKIHLVKATAENPALKALVGEKSWVNLSTQTVQANPTPA
ncbi:MAG TPA: hypothetical protein VGO93_11195 [Candidatus Xenobia bacterium]|jgi:hypothetical protein